MVLALPSFAVSRCNLLYRTAGSDDWVPLQGLDGETYNVKEVLFDGGLTFTQANTSGAAKCTVKVSVSGHPSVEVSDNLTTTTQIDVEVVCDAVHDPNFTSAAVTDMAKSHGIALAQTFPLATMSKNFAAVRLTDVKWKFFKGNIVPIQGTTQTSKGGHLKAHLETLLMFPALGPSNSDAGAYIKEIFKASHDESEAQEAELKTLEGCRIKTFPHPAGRHILVVQVWPNQGSINEVDPMSHKLAQRYIIRDAKTLFPAAQLEHHQILGSGKTEHWEMTVLSKPSRKIAAPIVGFVSNAIPIRALHNFEGEALDVKLEPIIDDVFGMRVRDTVRDNLGGANAVNTQEAVEMLDPNQQLTPLPVQNMFLTTLGAPQASDLVHEKGKVLADKLQQLKGWDESLETAQGNAVLGAIMNTLFRIWGPPATGKSFVLAEILKRLLNDKDEKVVVCASQNVAVNELFEKTATKVKRLGWKRTALVRVFSISQVLAQYGRSDEILKHEHHIEFMRIQEASQDKTRYASYLKAVEVLTNSGKITDPELFNAWSKATLQLTEQVMKNVRMAFCTTAGIRSSALYRKDKKTGEEWSWPATTCVFDEIGAAHDYEVLLPILTFKSTLRRLIVAGDYKQLPPYAASPLAKLRSRKTWFEHFIQRKFPQVQLNVQFRTLEEAYVVNHAFYDDQVSSRWSMANPGPLAEVLRTLQGQFPITATPGPCSYSINEIINFLNVANGSSYTPHGSTSSANKEEADVIIACVAKFIELGWTQSQIGVMTGYVEQRRLLQDMAFANDWEELKIGTIDATQGAQYKIIFLSLVKTKGELGFMAGDQRACVSFSRHEGALYVVGDKIFWTKARKSGFTAVNRLLNQMAYTSRPGNPSHLRPLYVDAVVTLPTSSTPSQPAPALVVAPVPISAASSSTTVAPEPALVISASSSTSGNQARIDALTAELEMRRHRHAENEARIAELEAELVALRLS